MLRFASLILIFTMAACGGDDSGSSGSSGVEGSKKLTELSASEQQDVCEFMVASQENVESKDCGDGITVFATTEAKCLAGFASFDASCTATVDNAEACAAAVSGDLCAGLTSPACAFQLTCLSSDSGI
ncbi:MAG: hypothetical protein HOV81_15120 [Kofleriaceae bacterium]|nr:hypothetical protein [Kofleriaceae bacterium]